MPIYCYECQKCHVIFDVRASFTEKENGLAPDCPQCHSKKTRQQITSGLVIRGGDGVEFSGPSCDPKAGPGCCGG